MTEKQQYFKKMIEKYKPDWSFTERTDIEFVTVEEGYVKTRIVLKKHHMNGIGSVHGGCLFTLADTTGGFAAMTRGSMVTSLGGEIHYFNAAMEETSKVLYADTVELKYGKKTSVYDVNITDDTGKKIARATMTYYNLGKKL